MAYNDIVQNKTKQLIKSGRATILGIETSCDETSAAVVADGRHIISNIVATQMDIHKIYGGVVPEIASRKHVEALNPVIDEAISAAGMKLADIDAVSVTYGPGLVGALLTGVAAAKSVSYSLQVPLIGVNHIEGHIHAPLLVHQELEPPFISLVVSGGHTYVLVVEDYCQYSILSKTLDDAAGEAYDKAARVIGLPYPGGPEIDRIAVMGERNISFPSPYLKDGNFSFSGIKTAVINHAHSAGMAGRELNVNDIAASFQGAVIDALVRSVLDAVKKTGIHKVALAGGVSANKGLRQAMQSLGQGITVYLPPIELCTDNAAMITSAAFYRLMRGEISALDLNAVPSLMLP